MARTTGLSTRDRWAIWALVVAILAVVVFLPGGFVRWVLPKEVVLVLAVVLATVARPGGRLPRFFWWLVAVGVAVLVASALIGAAVSGAAPLAQLLGRWPRYEGLVSLPVYVAAAWLAARTLGPLAPLSRARTFFTTLSVAAILIAVLGVAEAFGARPIASDLARPGSLLGNATDQGIVGAAIAVALALPLLRAFVGRGSAARRVVLAGGFVAAVIAVIVAASRAGLLALGVGLALLAVVHLVEVARTNGRAALVRRALAVAGVGAIIAAATLAVPFTRARLTGASQFAADTVGDRLVIWSETVRMLLSTPLTGVGPSGFEDAIVTRHTDAWYARVSDDIVLDSPHSWPLQAAAAGGLPLLALALVFCGYLTWRVWGIRAGAGVPATPAAVVAGVDTVERRDLVLAAFAALVALGVGLATHFSSAATGILIGLFVGIVLAIVPRTEPVLWRRARTGLAVTWLVLLALATGAEIPLQQAVIEPSAARADALFGAASALRPWDADIASIAAQSLAARADSGDAEAANAAIAWAHRSLDVLPQSVPTRTALGVAQRASGDARASSATFADLAAELPRDATIAYQHGVSLAVAGDFDAARTELERGLRLRPGDANIRAVLAQLSGT